MTIRVQRWRHYFKQIANPTFSFSLHKNRRQVTVDKSAVHGKSFGKIFYKEALSESFPGQKRGVGEEEGEALRVNLSKLVIISNFSSFWLSRKIST